MTERLYYDNAYLWEFDGTVTQVRPGKKKDTWDITLDRTWRRTVKARYGIRLTDRWRPG